MIGIDAVRRIGVDLFAARFLLDPRRWIGSSPLGSPLSFARSVRSMFRDGAMVIETPLEGERIGARTLVQPDGDVLGFVDEEMLGKPDLLDAHHRSVRVAQEQLGAWLGALRFTTRVALRVAALWTGVTGFLRAIAAEAAGEVARAMAPFLACVLLQLAIWLAMRAVVSRLRG